MQSRDVNIVEFLSLLLSFNREKRVYFLKQISLKYATVIRELAVNLLLNRNFDLSEKEKTYWKNNLQVLKEIGSRGFGLTKRRDLFVKKQLLIRRLVAFTYQYLTQE